MRYLVTGAAGFIASRVCERLLADGHQVVGLDNLNDYYDVRLKHFRLARIARSAGAPEDQVAQWIPKELISAPVPAIRTARLSSFVSGRFEFHPADVESESDLDRVFAGAAFDCVFNLAARAGVRASIAQPHAYVGTNVGGALNVLEAMRRHGVRKQILASSSSLYAGCPLPFSEDQPVNAPRSPYAATKKAAEMLAHSYHAVHGIETTALRYFTVFGPAGRPDMSPFRFIRWIEEGRPIQMFGDGRQTRDFTFVEDIVRGTILASRLPGFEIINLGGGNLPVSLLTLVSWLEEFIGKKAAIEFRPPNEADVEATSADIAKARRLLNWQPEVDPREGFERTVAWHLENRDWVSSLVL